MFSPNYSRQLIYSLFPMRQIGRRPMYASQAMPFGEQLTPSVPAATDEPSEVYEDQPISLWDASTPNYESPHPEPDSLPFSTPTFMQGPAPGRAESPPDTHEDSLALEPEVEIVEAIDAIRTTEPMGIGPEVMGVDSLPPEPTEQVPLEAVAPDNPGLEQLVVDDPLLDELFPPVLPF